jgi:hypothetical protein
MRCLFAIVLVLSVQQASSAEFLTGTAVLTYQQQSKYQPGSCSEQTLAKEDDEFGDEICIDMRSWQIYAVTGFRDLKGNQHGIKSLVATAHTSLSGEWLLVLEKLSEGEAAKFGAEYKVVNRSLIMQAVCLDTPIEKYTGNEAAPPRLAQTEGWYCYNMLSLPRK